MDSIDMASEGRQHAVDHAMVTGRITVNSKAAVALKAGSTELSGRNYMRVTNSSDFVPVRLGGSGITWKSGEQLDPGETREFWFDKSVATSIYGISTGVEAVLEITEA